MEAYQNLGTIGEGTYGIVLKCRHKETGQIVAIKQFKKTDEDKKVHKTVQREVRVLKLLRHPNIVSLLDSFKYKGRTCIVMEYVQKTILECLKVHPHGLDNLLTRQITWQLVKALEYMHNQKVPLLHRDVKPENILVSDQGMVKLCDFGFARPGACSSGRGDPLSDYVATRWYRSPELLVGDPYYGPSIDVWAIGCMAVEMLTGEPLFPGDSDVDQLWLILKCMGQLPPAYAEMLSCNEYFVGMRQPGSWEREPLERRFRHFDPQMLQFLMACLHIDPAKRLTCSELLRLPYLTGVENTIPTTILKAQEKASEERELLVKMRRHKRKSAEVEPEAPARPVFNLTASAHASQPDAARYHIHSTGQPQPAGQSGAQRMHAQRQASQHEQSSSRAEQAELPAQHTLCTVSTALPQAPSRLCLQLPLGTHQQQQLQAHLQLHQRYQMDLAAGHLAEQLQHQQGSCRAADQHRQALDSSASAGSPALSSWSQAPARSSAELQGSCGAEDSSATGLEEPVDPTVATEMDVSPEKQQRAPRSMPQDDLRRVAARQQRFMTQMLGKEGGEKIPDSGLAVTSATHKLSLAATQPELIHLQPGKYTFNSSMMPTTPQAGDGIRAVYSFGPRQGHPGSHTAAPSAHPRNPAQSASQQNSTFTPPEHHKPTLQQRKDTSMLAPQGLQAKPEHRLPNLQRTQSHPGLRRSQRRTLTHGQ
ncbi:g10397 [Coccomyxa viridis]|uniref:G10397 protein n=1 Tax=Coccomyxa viridis TaxID=1274662 RepID=A0ABP1G5K7_9CHLO